MTMCVWGHLIVIGGQVRTMQIEGLPGTWGRDPACLCLPWGSLLLSILGSVQVIVWGEDSLNLLSCLTCRLTLPPSPQPSDTISNTPTAPIVPLWGSPESRPAFPEGGVLSLRGQRHLPYHQCPVDTKGGVSRWGRSHLLGRVLDFPPHSFI